MSKDQPTEKIKTCQEESVWVLNDESLAAAGIRIEPGAGTAPAYFESAQEQAERDWKGIEARTRNIDWAAIARGDSAAEKIILRHHVGLTPRIAENVKARCNTLDLSPLGLADRMGASPGLVRKILSGQGQIRRCTADRLLVVLGVDLWQYLRVLPDKVAESGLANPKSLSLLSRVKIIAKKFLTWARAMILWR